MLMLSSVWSPSSVWIFSALSILSSASAFGAELFFMDRDSFNNEYVGPVGPLVLSGEIVPGDYARLLSKIGADENRFLAQNELLLASTDGDSAEAIKIANLIKSLYTRVVVGPLTGRCAGACFLIYAAATERNTDGQSLLGIHRLGLAASEWASMPAAQAALLEDGAQAPIRQFLAENEVPPDLIDELFKHEWSDVYWLSDADEAKLGSKSPSFQKFLAKKCAWNDSLERAVYKGERPLDDLKEFTACRARVTQAEAHKALGKVLKEAQAATDAQALKQTQAVKAAQAH